MVKKIEFEWPSIGIKAEVALLEEEEPELCEALWKTLKAPLRLFCRHPVSAGCEYGAESRPPRHPIAGGTHASPLGRKRWILSEIKAGSIMYHGFGGFGGLSFFYGPVSEQLPSRGSIVAEVDEEDIDDFVKAGRAVWNAQYITHHPMIMIARRKE